MRASLLRIREMLRKEWRQLFRDPKSKRIVFMAPVVQLVLFGYAVNTDVHDVTTFVVDHDQTQQSRGLVAAFTAGHYFRVVGRSARPADLTAALDGGRARIGLQIPVGFARDLEGGHGATVQVLVDGTNSNTATVAQGYAARIIQEYGLQHAHGAVINARGVDLRTRAWYNPDLLSRVYNVPAVIGTLLMLMCFLLTALAVVREREVGTLEQLLVSPLTPTELMLGKTIPIAFVALIDLSLITVVAVLWFRIPLEGSVLALLLAAILYIIAALGVGLLISSSARTQQEAFMLMFLVLLPLIILSGFMYPVDTMPWIFQKITLVNPVRHFLEVVRGIFLKGEGIRDLWVQYSVLAVSAVVSLWVATWRFKRTLG